MYARLLWLLPPRRHNFTHIYAHTNLLQSNFIKPNGIERLLAQTMYQASLLIRFQVQNFDQ